ncbi:MAG: DUF2167 domain-containing protein [Magnetococcales bacterium]|nr:DUF2167 domain-containing protein [Magnetococcales bacterium]MBF0156678.1 DUF2167 domain-containing protein [Magnetococcales bacterium]
MGVLLRSVCFVGAIFGAILGGSVGVWASQTDEEIERVLAEVGTVAEAGPREILLLDQARLDLSEGKYFVPQPTAGRFMQAFGNSEDPTLVGVIGPQDDSDWLVVINYESSGYIRDDDAKNWNVDELFQSLKDGTEATNAERRSRGFPALEIVGWVEKPSYDPVSHHLVWSMEARHEGAPADAETSVNYNTYALGREGFLSLNLITKTSLIATEKDIARELLSRLTFLPGKAYGDFDESTDRVAEYGLAALVAGVAAKKLGFFAVIAAFALKFSKVIVVALGALGAAFFGSRKKKTGGSTEASPKGE